MRCNACGAVHGFGAVDHLGNRVPGGFGQGLVIDRSTNPWDTSQWTVTEWAAAAGLVASVIFAWSLLKK